MNLTRCEKGHYYDADAYASCPHCRKGDYNPTVPTDRNNGGGVFPPTESLSQDEKNPEKKNHIDVDRGDDVKTVRHYDDNTKLETEPVVGWLVCVAGSCMGQDYKLKAGKNFIGRASNMDVVLNMDNKVSRDRHAILIYEPRSRQFIVQPGDSRELFYLNDKVVLVNEVMNPKNIITVGNTKLMLIPCCDADFCWEDVIKEEN